jgi:type II secretory pathway pseudopilin PulG
MIEIAISLAVIGFALVAIIGILPAGMSVQKENRQETIITQDATVFMNAIRNGDRGIDDLTNFVVAITNFGGYINPANGNIVPFVSSHTFTGSQPPGYPITNGLRIVGLLSTPKYEDGRSNYIVAYARSISGLGSEKFPQDNKDAQDFALGYRMLVETLPLHTNHFEASWTNFLDPGIAGQTNVITSRSNYWRLVRNYQSNYHDLRLTFRWPYQNGKTGNGRQVFRTTVTGSMSPTNEPGFPLHEHRLFFLQPRDYVQVNP